MSTVEYLENDPVNKLTALKIVHSLVQTATGRAEVSVTTTTMMMTDSEHHVSATVIVVLLSWLTKSPSPL